MFGQMIPNPKSGPHCLEKKCYLFVRFICWVQYRKSFIELCQKWPAGGISYKKWFRYFPVHRFFSKNQDVVMKKIEKRNHKKNDLGIQKYFHLHFVGSDFRKSIMSQIFNRTSLNCINRFTLLGFNASKNTSQLMARFNSKKSNGGELKLGFKLRKTEKLVMGLI